MSRPNAGKKPNRFGWIVFMMVAAGSVLYVYTSDDSSAAKKPPTKLNKGAKSNGSDYTALDSSLMTAELKVAPKDAFLPIVARGTGNSADVGPVDIPNILTGGEEWAYTGMVQVNGKNQAVFENTKTSDTAFLSMGDKWKKAKVGRISDSAVELADESGKIYVVKMSEAPVKNDTLPAVNANAQDATTALSGPIGTQQLDVTPLPAAGGQFGGPGRRRRGGFGGGGYAPGG